MSIKDAVDLLAKDNKLKFIHNIMKMLDISVIEAKKVADTYFVILNNSQYNETRRKNYFKILLIRYNCKNHFRNYQHENRQ